MYAVHSCRDGHIALNQSLAILRDVRSRNKGRGLVIRVVVACAHQELCLYSETFQKWRNQKQTTGASRRRSLPLRCIRKRYLKGFPRTD